MASVNNSGTHRRGLALNVFDNMMCPLKNRNQQNPRTDRTRDPFPIVNRPEAKGTPSLMPGSTPGDRTLARVVILRVYALKFA